MSERELIEGLARLAEPVVPGDDPYGRLMRRHRRSRRTKAGGWATGAVLAVVAALLGPIGIQGASTPVHGGPSTPADVTPGGPVTPWVARLLSAPTRGSLAGDTAFLTELAERLDARFPEQVAGGRVKLLFAGEAGGGTVVLAARHSATHQVGIAIFDKPGATAAELALANTEQRQEGSVSVSTGGIGPLLTETVTGVDGLWAGYLTVGVVPQGCGIELADGRAATLSWRPSPTDGYFVLRSRYQLLRLTCDGVVRYQGDADRGMAQGFGRARPSAAEIEQGLVGARGELDREWAGELLRHDGIRDSADLPRILYQGRLPGAPEDVQRVAVLIQGRPDGSWMVNQVRRSGMSHGVDTSVDLSAADRVLALESGWLADEQMDRVRPSATPPASPVPFLVLAPRGAVTVQALDDDGTVVAWAGLTDGVGTLQLTRPARLRALDAAGAQVGTGVTTLPERKPMHLLRVEPIDDWS
ncbi:hypothetical protein [Catellatospora citrea]|uniref:Uncharacterized protein n=1 Tax=Catellatospora citrea TaxID=53366 RepID=A0A8J3KNT0_9ACTN|nr:hypothetical protein [Catellatospora citrea]RKE09826.1 hypothetical protein C8E86_4717 [Catellatospora citrea]GIG00624.1 hypothetical protein Cci01nite_57170 [Catellatospora citrea]